MIVILLGCLYVVAVAWAASRFREADTYVSPVTMVGLSGFVYLVTIPVEVAISGVPFGAMASVGDATLVVLLALAAFVSFALAYGIALNRDRTIGGAVERVRAAPHGSSKLPLGVAIGGALVIALVFPSAVIQAGTYEGNISLVAGNSLYAIVVKFTMQSYAIWAFIRALRSTGGTVVQALVRAMPLVVWGIYSSDKDPLVLAALTMAGWLLRRYRDVRSRIGFIIVFIGAALAIGLATFVFSVSRAGGQGIWTRIVDGRGLFRQIEPAGPMRSVLTSLNSPPGQDYLYGESVLRGYIMWIPQFLWEGRPLDLSEQYARAYMVDWEPGRAFGFSLVAEGLLNGGVVGVILLFALFGLQVALLRNVMLRPSPYGSFDGIKLGALFVPALFVCFISLRGPFSSLITQSVHAIALIAVMWIATGVLALLRNTSASRWEVNR